MASQDDDDDTTEQPVCPKCKSSDNIVVETEMSGSMIIQV